MSKTFLITLLLTLAACTPLVTATPPPAPQLLRVAYPSSLADWVDDLGGCALRSPEIALTLFETSPIGPEFEEADLTLWFGEPPPGFEGYAAALGADEIIIITGSRVGLNQIEAESLARLYQSSENLYHPWSYAPGNELRAIFDQEILHGAASSPDVRLAPHPQAMLEAVTADPLAIGYLPKAWLTKEVKVLPLSDRLEIPILALTAQEPTGAISAFLVCLQQESAK